MRLVREDDRQQSQRPAIINDSELWLRRITVEFEPAPERERSQPDGVHPMRISGKDMPGEISR
jgi:hypothetical protein